MGFLFCSLMRPAFMVLAALCASACLAQKATEYAYTIAFTEPITQTHEKFILEGLRSQDPDALVWFNAAEQNVLTRVHSPLDRDQLQAFLLSCGAVITYLGRPVTDHVALKSSRNDMELGLPDLIDTGAPATDNVRYELEKKAWVEAHPTEYEQLTRPE